MRNNMKLILEGWRQTTLLEGVVDLIKNKSLDDEAVEEIGDKLSDNEGFQLAVKMFSAIDQMDPEEVAGLDEASMDWLTSKIVQGVIAKDNLMNTIKSDPRFAPILKLTPAALALSFLYFKHASGAGIGADDFTTAAELIMKKGKIDLDSLAQGTSMLENTKE